MTKIKFIEHTERILGQSLPEKADLRPERVYLRPEGADCEAERADDSAGLRLEMAAQVP